MSNATTQGGEPFMSDQHEGQWGDDAIVAMLKRRQHHTTLQNGWHLITLISAAELMRMVRDDLQAQIDALRQELAARQVFTDDYYAGYAVGMQTEREHQEALCRLVMQRTPPAPAVPAVSNE